MNVLLANPRGFCAGVNMAVDALDAALAHFGPPIYVYHEIVHNRPIVEAYRAKGAVFVDELAEVPAGQTVLYSAHGVSPQIRGEAKERGLRTIDATCPLVTKVHLEAVKFTNEGYRLILIGHEGHDEVIGTMGEAPHNISLVETPEDVDALPFTTDDKLAFLTQTTLSVSEANRVIERLRARFPQIKCPPKEDICYATTNRQEAVSAIAPEADLVLVLGSQNSSNSQRLRELATEVGKPAYLIDGVHELQPRWFEGVATVVVTAGASAPEVVVQEVLDWLVATYQAVVETRTIREEHVHFPLPRELRQMQAAAAT